MFSGQTHSGQQYETAAQQTEYDSFFCHGLRFEGGTEDWDRTPKRIIPIAGWVVVMKSGYIYNAKYVPKL